MSCKVLFVSLMILSAAGCSRVDDDLENQGGALSSQACSMPADLPRVVEVAEVISDPELYQGRFISLEGYYCSSFERSGIFSNPDCESAPASGIWLSGVSPFYRTFNKKVIVVGRYDAFSRGHMAQWSGTLCVSKIVVIGGGPMATSVAL